LDTGLEGDIEKASLLLYLNKTCYNGLYRVNRKGEFNVPWGRYRNPTILDESNLRAVHRMVKGKETRILCCDYATAVEDAAAGDFIYFDPPYQPISTTANFTQYTVEGFTIKEQERLANAIAQLDSKGCYCMLSNSPKVRPLYEKHGYSIKAVNVLRSISCVGNKRGPVEELLVMNYTSYRARSVL
jgi:DNA adenine methylase